MLRKCTSLALVAVAGAVLSIGTHAGAQTIVQSFTIPTQATPFTSTQTFNLFDTTLGTLNSVTLSLGTSITAEVDVFNLRAAASSFTGATASIPVQVTGPDSSSVTATAVAGPVSGTTPAGKFSEFIASGLTATASNTTNVLPANFASYSGVGLGTATLNIAALAGTYAGTGSTVSFSGSATAGGTFTITYGYTPTPPPTPTPEPGVATFMAAGVLGSLGMVLRRRRNNK